MKKDKNSSSTNTSASGSFKKDSRLEKVRDRPGSIKSDVCDTL